jgi:hypothetical protein
MSIFGSPFTDFTSVFSSGPGTLQQSAAMNTAIGDFIVVCVFGSALVPGTTITLADLAGNTYTARALQYESSGGQGFKWFYCIAAHAHATNKITATFSAGFIVAMAVAKFPITAGTPVFDVESTIQNNSNVTNPAISPSISPTGADEIILATLADGGSEPTFTAGSGYTLVSSAGLAFPRQRFEYGIFVSPGAGSASFPFTGSGVTNDMMAIAFKASGGGGGGGGKSIVFTIT